MTIIVDIRDFGFLKVFEFRLPPRIHRRKFEGSELVCGGITTTKNVEGPI
jgi:hypothetical protein